MDESCCQSFVDTELGESAGYFAFNQGAKQKNQHVPPRIVVGVEIANAPVVAVVSRKEAAGETHDLRGPMRLGMDVHLPLEKEALLLEQPGGLAKSLLEIP